MIPKSLTVNVVAADIPAVKAEIERLQAENAMLRAVLDGIYPSLYSRAVQLDLAGETVAAEAWSGICRQVAATWPKPGTAT